MDVAGHEGRAPSPYAADGFFAVLADSIPHIVFTTAPEDGRIEYFNRRWFDYTGLTPEQTYGGFGYRQAVHPDDLERVIECGKRARQSGVETSTDARYRRADGVYRWHRVTALPYRDADGTIVRWLGTVIDIHDERSADRAFRTIAGALPFLLWTATADGIIEFSNDRWYDYVDSLDAQLTDIMHPNDVAEVLASWQQSLENGKTLNQVMRMRNRHGVYRWHRTTAVPFHDDELRIARWYGVTIDIHDELTRHDAIDTDIETRIARDVTRNTPVLMFMMDPDGKVTFVNERWSELTGLPASELVGWGIAQIVEPSDLKRIGAEFRSRAPSDNEVVLRYRICDRDWRYRWIETRSVPERDAAGNVIRWTGIGIEIEEHVRALATLEFLLASGADVSVQTDVPTLMEALAKRVIENLADGCIVDLVGDGGRISRIFVARPEDEHLRDGYEVEPVVLPEDQHPVADAIYRGRTTFVPIVDEEFLDAAIDDPMRRKRWDRAHSVIVAPIRTAEKIYGAISIIRKMTPQPFQFSDMQVTEDIGRRVGLALANVELVEKTRRESEDRLEHFRRIADFAPQLMWTTDPRGYVDWVNLRWYEFTGQAPDEAIDGRRGTTIPVHEEDRERSIETWIHAVETGVPYEAEVRLRRHDGVYRWCIARAVPERDEAGNVVRWYGSTTDIDDARRAARTMQVFASLGERLSESAGLDDTMEAILDIVVPEFADLACITLLDDDGDFIVRAVQAHSPSQHVILQSLLGKTHVSRDSTVGSRGAAISGRPYVDNEISDAKFEHGLTPLGAAVARRLNIRALAAIPLQAANGRVLGSLVLEMTESQRRFEQTDVPFYVELARRITPAIVNAELFERERNVAHSFQEAALPSHLPRVPGYAFDAVYEAGLAEALIGGDWFDAFTLLDGRIVISIGDVAGAGLRAAVMMSNVRQAIRGVAQVHADPALMLEAADGVLRSQYADTYVTAFVGVIDPMTNTIAYQSAGHPRPLLVRPDGELVELEGGGLPLGLRSEHEPLNAVHHVPSGALLVLYTDGLVESTHELEEGYRRLLQTVSDERVRRAASPAKSIYDIMLPEGSKDDVAILTVRIGDVTRGRAFPISSAHDEPAVRSMQQHLFAALREGGMNDDALLAAELIVAELIGNLARYAPGPAVFTLTWNEGVPVLHVQDSGPGYEFAAKLPADPLAESGRGLFLIASLARNFVVSSRPGGGSISRVVFKL